MPNLHAEQRLVHTHAQALTAAAKNRHPVTQRGFELPAEPRGHPLTRSLLPAVAAVVVLAACGPGTTANGAKPTPPKPATSELQPPAAAHTAGTCHEVDGRADKTCTPGVTNPDVTQATIHSTICVSGWTKTVRPPASYTDALKRQQITEYGYSDTNPADYEEDHLIPLEVGGNPTDPRNLWPEPHGGARGSKVKDPVENQFKTAVCSGSMTLDAARAQILADWTH